MLVESLALKDRFHKSGKLRSILIQAAWVALALTVSTLRAQQDNTKISNKIAVSANLGGYSLTGPLGFDTSQITKAGTLIVQLSLTSSGAVKDAVVVSGDADLRPQVLARVRQWQFVKNRDLPENLQVWIYFVETAGKRIDQVPPMMPPPPVGARLLSVDISGATAEEERELRRVIGAKAGDTLTQQVWDRAKKAAYSCNPPMNFIVRLGANGLPYIKIWR